MRKNLVIILINIVIVILEIIGLVLGYRNNGVGLFVYYTELSNIFAMFACTFYVAYLIKNIDIEITDVPKWILNMKYMSASCLAVTFSVVVCVLVPMAESKAGARHMLIEGAQLYHHILCPILAVISLVLIERDQKIEKRDNRIALIPTFLYAVVIVILNCARVIKGPYPFLYVYEQSWFMSVIWFLVIMGIAYLFAWMIRVLNNKSL